MIHKDVTKLIGYTPMVRLNNLITEENAEVLVKLECFNPGGSIKDRIALNMINKAEQSGELKKMG